VRLSLDRELHVIYDTQKKLLFLVPRISAMDYNELLNHLQVVGKDPSRLIFEDELTGL